MKQYVLILTLALLMTVPVACGDAPAEEPDAADDGATTATEQVEGAEESAEPVGMISSGSAQPPATRELPSQPSSDVTQRPAEVSAVIEAVTFTVLAPTDLPENTHLDIVYLVQSATGEASDDLPAARFIYNLDSGGAVIIYQSPATGEAPVDGTTVQVGEYDGWLVSQSPPIMVWEQDGVRLEMRGVNVAPEVMLSIATSMAPAEADPAGSSLGGDATPTGEETGSETDEAGGTSEGGSTGDE